MKSIKKKTKKSGTRKFNSGAKGMPTNLDWNFNLTTLAGWLDKWVIWFKSSENPTHGHMQLDMALRASLNDKVDWDNASLGDVRMVMNRVQKTAFPNLNAPSNCSI